MKLCHGKVLCLVNEWALYGSLREREWKSGKTHALGRERCTLIECMFKAIAGVFPVVRETAAVPGRDIAVTSFEARMWPGARDVDADATENRAARQRPLPVK